MPLEGHWARQQAPLRAPASRLLYAGCAALAVLVLVLVLTVGGGKTNASSPGCVDVTIASTTGGAAMHACGTRAVELCSATGATREILDACRHAGIASDR
jgi:hypothetical protein